MKQSGNIIFRKNKTKNNVLVRIKDFVLKYKFLNLMVLPCIIWLICFKYGPMLGLVIAFKNYRGVGSGFAGILEAPWIGFKNFQIFFNSIYFLRLLKNTLVISFSRIIFAFPIPIIFALLLNEVRNKHFKKTIQTISYMPYFLSWVIITALTVTIFSTDSGPINAVLEKIGIKPIYFLANKHWFRPIVVLTGLWQSAGWSSIIYLAAISGIPVEPYEAARIDGANKFKMILHITLPGIVEIIVIMLILQVGRAMTDNFEQIFNMYSPAVYEVGDIFDTYVYRAGITEGKFSYAASVGLFKAVSSLILVMGTNTLAKKLGAGGIW